MQVDMVKKEVDIVDAAARDVKMHLKPVDLNEPSRVFDQWLICYHVKINGFIHGKSV